MKIICFIFGLIILLSSCNKLNKDEELSLKRVSYTGNDIRLDGYYYSYYVNNATPPVEYIVAFFLYRNGVILSAGAFETTILDIAEKEMLERYQSFHNKKIGWGVYIVTENKLEYEQWSTSVGGGLPVFRSSYNIENDTTLTNKNGRVYHFRQFSPKPDSTNNFIK